MKRIPTNFKFIVVSLVFQEHWTTLVEEENGKKLDWAMHVSVDKLILCYMEDVKVSRFIVLDEVWFCSSEEKR